MEGRGGCFDGGRGVGDLGIWGAVVMMGFSGFCGGSVGSACACAGGERGGGGGGGEGEEGRGMGGC